MVHLESWDAAITKFPILGSDPRHAKDKAGFQAVYNENAGWVEPLGAMRALERECKRLGVKFTSGVGGTVVELLQDQDGKSVMGVRTRDGRNWIADKTIIAAGCYSDTLLDFKNQLQAVSRSPE